MARYLALALLYAALALSQGCESESSDINPKRGASEAEETAADLGVSVNDDASTHATPHGLSEFSWLQNDLSLAAEKLLDEPIDAVWGLEGGRLLIRNDDQLTLFATGEWGDPLFIGARVVNVIRGSDDTLIHTDEGLFVLRDDQLNSSPLNRIYPNLRALVGVDGDRFWLVEQDRLTLWQEDTSFTIEFACPNEDVYWRGGLYSGQPTLMFWRNREVSIFEFSNGTIMETTVNLTSAPTSVAMNDGGLWLITEDGLLHRDGSGQWRVNPSIAATSRLVATFHQPFLYILDADIVRRVDLSNETTVTMPTVWSDATVSSNGDLLIYGESGLHRVRAPRSLEIDGTYDGPMLEDTMLSATIDPPDAFQSPRWTNELGDLITEGWTLTLDAETVSPGRFSITFSALDSSGETIGRDIELEGPPSWEGHVAPLSNRWCQNCHGTDSSFPLATSAEWVAHFDLILYDLETGRMPLTPNKPTDAETALIRGWGEGGFQFLGENE